MAPADREAYTVARIRDVVSHHMVSDSRTSCHATSQVEGRVHACLDSLSVAVSMKTLRVGFT